MFTFQSKTKLIWGREMDIFGPSILPAAAILDPDLTVGLPPRLTALTGLDAFSHAVEAYVCNRANPISDAIAERAMQMVVDNIRQATVNGRDLIARENMLLASAMAVIAASNAGGLGVQRDDIPALAELALLDGCTPPNPRPIDKEDFIRLYERALNQAI